MNPISFSGKASSQVAKLFEQGVKDKTLSPEAIINYAKFLNNDNESETLYRDVSPFAEALPNYASVKIGIRDANGQSVTSIGSQVDKKDANKEAQKLLGEFLDTFI